MGLESRKLWKFCRVSSINSFFASSTDWPGGLFDTSSEKLLNICKEVKATKYVSGPGGKNYLDEKIFQKNHIDIEYRKYTPILYSQLNSKSFIPNLSILDLLFNMGYESRKFVL